MAELFSKTTLVSNELSFGRWMRCSKASRARSRIRGAPNAADNPSGRDTKMRNSLATLAAASTLLTGIVQAQVRTPTDIELKAAYCLRMNQMFIVASRNQQPYLSDPELENSIKDAEYRADRLRSYLAPSKQLDPAAMQGAMKRAEIDKANSAGEQKSDDQCEPGCQDAQQPMRCIYECTNPKRDEQLAARIRSCWTLNWLPAGGS